jgi:phenylacetate-CoA ligase
MLLEKERGDIQETFGCPVTNRYGCEEVGLIASECDRHQGLHLNVDHLFIEFLRPDGSPASPGEEARIVVTDLVNRGMPFIRYDVGDMVMSSDRVCECGRGLPLVERVTGRVADFLKRRDGSLVAGVSLVERTLTAIPGLDQMQIIQESMDRITLNIVPDESYDPESEKRLREEVTGIFGEGTQLNVVPCESLPQTRSGKYRFSICLV